MKLRLYRRSYGIHHLVRQLTIKLNFKDVVKSPKDPNDDFLIKEDIVLEHMNGHSIPLPENCLLTIGNNYSGSTAQRHPIFFKPWGKYFDSFVLELAP
jgi:hypothetical protein